MCQPGIITEGWADVADDFKRTGFFRDGNLDPGVVPRFLGEFIRRYTVIIGYGAEGVVKPIGSGTFLRRTDREPGILTAGHVIDRIMNKEDLRVLPMQDRSEAVWPRIGGEGMRRCGRRNSASNGPDIGWLPLSAEEVHKVEALGAVFYNREKARDPFCGSVLQVKIAFGFVDEASSLKVKEVVAHGLLMGCTGRREADAQGWDYDEYAITNDDSWIPSTYGGVSGSAVWRIDMPLDYSKRKSILLKGVMFAEGPPNDRKLIAHGESSLTTFLDEC